ncbi:uncharacterized protein LOC110455216 [Mizuhopecten yessoensis]|uniref:uncharacterized protein LOC110455216 n=1 Tax=Mizuhopecten yessoensis TaxID=6573 RepID=UPI000B45DAE7|nr:uncharacterized protein LOC110455216 [Mizuhopecten yessoensis]
MSDNGPQFGSAEFREFAREYGFEHTTTSPYHAQSNGQVERMVQTVKRLLFKAKDPYLALLEYRNTRIDGVEMSPAQMFLGRRLKTPLPATAPLLTTNANTQIYVSLKLRQARQQENFNKHAMQKPLKPLDPGDHVMVKHPAKGTWEAGIVERQHTTPRSYVVESNGRKYRRNRRYLKQTRARAEVDQTYDSRTMNYDPVYDYPRRDLERAPDPVHQEVIVRNDTREVVTTPPISGQKMDPSEPLPKVTRSGRAINIPARYRD